MVKASLAWIKKHRKITIATVVVVVISSLFWAPSLFGQQNKTSFTTTKAEKGTIVSSVSASGQSISANIMNVTTQASGSVSQIYVKEGDSVKKGDKILDIALDEQGQQKNAQAWSSYLSAKNSLDSAQVTQYTLQSDMFSKWKTFYNLATSSTYQNPDGTPNETNRTLPEFLIPQKDWLAAEAKYKNQQSVVTQAQAALNSSWLTYQMSSPTVTAPIDGTVSNLTLVEGMNISQTSTSDTTSSSSSQRVAVIQNNQLPLVSFNLSEIDVSRVKPGQKATITLDSIHGKTFVGKVMTVDRIGSVSSGVTNYPTIIQLDTKVPEIIPNMAANANIIVESKNDVLLVPSSAIQTINEQSYVRILKGGKEQQIAVETGLSSDTQTEIISGLSEGDEVITGSTAGNAQNGSPFSTFGGGRSGMMFRSVGR